MDLKRALPASLSILVLTVVLWAPGASAEVFDLGKYPDWSGQWIKADPGPNRYDPSRPPGRGQQAPLTLEYQALFEASLADVADGGQGNDMTYRCLPHAMPKQMIAVAPMEFVLTPTTVYVLFESTLGSTRRIYTDGRNWPEVEESTYAGYSIGRWIDSENGGRYDTLEIETRNIRGPHTADNSGIPFHADGQTIVKERIYRDKVNPDILHNDTTTIDHALTRPWSATKSYKREKNVLWVEGNCNEGNTHVAVGKEDYAVSADGYLMPVRKGQAPPDLRYFNQPRK
jgi:hypothetical protein